MREGIDRLLLVRLELGMIDLLDLEELLDTEEMREIEEMVEGMQEIGMAEHPPGQSIRTIEGQATQALLQCHAETTQVIHIDLLRGDREAETAETIDEAEEEVQVGAGPDRQIEGLGAGAEVRRGEDWVEPDDLVRHTARLVHRQRKGDNIDREHPRIDQFQQALSKKTEEEGGSSLKASRRCYLLGSPPLLPPSSASSLPSSMPFLPLSLCRTNPPERNGVSKMADCQTCRKNLYMIDDLPTARFGQGDHK